MTFELRLEASLVHVARHRGAARRDCIASDRGQARFQALPRLLARELRHRRAFRHGIFRQARLAERQLQAAAARDLHGILERLGNIGEQLRHLCRRAQVLLLGVAAYARGIREQASFVDADARLVGFEVFAPDEAHLVGRHHGRRASSHQLECRCDVVFLARTADALQLDIEAIAEQRLPILERLARLGAASAREGAADVTSLRSRQCEQATSRLRREPASLEERLAPSLALEVGAAQEPRQIAITLEVLAQERETRRLGAFAGFAHQHVDADDRLDALPLRRPIELHHREQVALVADRHRRHARRRHRLHELRHAHDPVDERVLGMQPQMNERSHGISKLSLFAQRRRTYFPKRCRSPQRAGEGMRVEGAFETVGDRMSPSEPPGTDSRRSRKPLPPSSLPPLAPALYAVSESRSSPTKGASSEFTDTLSIIP